MTVLKNNLYIGSITIADCLGRDHKNIARVIRRHRQHFQELGGSNAGLCVQLHTSKNGHKMKVYFLSETQVIFLLSILDNDQIILDFKKRLAAEFVSMKKIIAERDTEEWKHARVESKQQRRQFTDSIKEYVEFARKQGSQSPERYYLIFSRLIDNAAGISNREYVSKENLEKIRYLEDGLSKEISQKMKSNIFYKEIYQSCKSLVQELLEHGNGTP